MEVSNNTLVGQPTWVQPKNRSQAINMILLGSDGSPLYPQGAHVHLTWPHNNMLTAEPQADIQARGEFGGAGHLEEPLSPVGRHDVEGSTFGTASHVPDDALSNRSARGRLRLHTTAVEAVELIRKPTSSSILNTQSRLQLQRSLKGCLQPKRYQLACFTCTCGKVTHWEL